MPLTSLQLKRWLNPWPIDLPKNKQWDFQVETLLSASRYPIFHGRRDPHPLTAKTFVRQLLVSMQKRTDPPRGYDGHYIEMLARDLVPQLRTLTIVVDKAPLGWRIIDGNHRFLACLLRRQQKLPMEIKFVGVVKEHANPS